MDYPKISIVTPSFNQGAYLEETILSVVSQNYPNLEYIIIDGGSTDASIEIIKKYQQHISYWVSEADQGLYHALQKGFEKSTGSIMGWINSDDMLHPRSLYVIANIFRHNNRVQWCQGHPTMFDESGMTVDNREPLCSKYYFYLKKYHNGRFIQQESTYWSRGLWEKAGSYISTDYKYAGDFELWMRFFQYELLYFTPALIGGFRVRKSQLSQTYFSDYLLECDRIIDQTKLGKEDVVNLRKIRFIEEKLMKVRWLRPTLDYYSKRLYVSQPPLKFNYQTGEFN